MIHTAHPLLLCVSAIPFRCQVGGVIKSAGSPLRDLKRVADQHRVDCEQAEDGKGVHQRRASNVRAGGTTTKTRNRGMSMRSRGSGHRSSFASVVVQSFRGTRILGPTLDLEVELGASGRQTAG